MLQPKKLLFFVFFAVTIVGAHFGYAADEPLGEQADCHCSAQNDRTPKSIPLATANTKVEASDSASIQKPSK